MPASRLASPYGYQTPIGQSLDSISKILFSGMGNRRESAAQEELRRAQTMAAQAQAEERMQKTRAANLAAMKRGDAPLNQAALVFGSKPMAQTYLNKIDTGKWGPDFVDSNAQGDIEGPPIPADMPRVVAPQPAEFTPENMRAANLALQGINLADAGAGNDTADNIAHAIARLTGLDVANRAEAGGIPSDALFRRGQAEYVNRGGAPFGGNSDVTRNLISGDTGNTAIGNARLPVFAAQATEREKAGLQHDASAIASRAAAGNSSASARRNTLLADQIARGDNLPNEIIDREGIPTIVKRADAINKPAGSRAGANLVAVPDPDNPGKAIWARRGEGEAAFAPGAGGILNSQTVRERQIATGLEKATTPHRKVLDASRNYDEVRAKGDNSQVNQVLVDQLVRMANQGQRSLSTAILDRTLGVTSQGGSLPERIVSSVSQLATGTRPEEVNRRLDALKEAMTLSAVQRIGEEVRNARAQAPQGSNPDNITGSTPKIYSRYLIAPTGDVLTYRNATEAQAALRKLQAAK